MLIPKVVGFRLTGELPDGATATDLVLTITELLRKHGVVGKFVEFYGDGVASVPVANRATIGNMSPEFGSTCAIFPIDAETLTYLRLTGRPAEQVALVEAYAKEQGLWHDPGQAARYSEELSSTCPPWSPRWLGPKRPQDRVALADAKTAFRDALGSYVPARPAGRRDRRHLPGVRPVRPGPGERRRRSGAREPRQTQRRSAIRARRRHARGRDRAPRWITAPSSSPPSPRARTRPTPRSWSARPCWPGTRSSAGLARKPWVKTTLAPGSKVVMDYYERAGLLPYLEKLGFNLVGYGCTTCIGNSGPLPERDQRSGGGQRPGGRLGAVRQPELRGPDQPRREDELPRLPAAGRRATPWPGPWTSICSTIRWAAARTERRSTCATSGPRRRTSPPWCGTRSQRRCSPATTPTCSRATTGGGPCRCRPATPSPGTPSSTYVRRPPYFEDMADKPAPVTDIHGARVLRDAGRLGDHRPHLPGGRDQGRQPGGPLPHRARGGAARLQLLRLAARQPRGDDPRHVRQHPAAQPAGSRHRGRGDRRSCRRASR